MATEKTLQSVYKPKKQIHNHKDLMEEHLENRIARRKLAAMRQVPSSLYAIKKDGSKKTAINFLVSEEYQAKITFLDFLMDNRKKKEDEIIRLYRIGTFDPETMAFTSEAAPVEIKASDDAQNMVIR